jgi:hypothetical protein
MFTRAEVILDVPFEVAERRLARLPRDNWLLRESEGAYDAGLVGLLRVGPLGEVPGASKLVRVAARDVVRRENTAVLTLRWEATGPGGALFPALDADISVTAAPEDGGRPASRLVLDGAYRPPMAVMGASLDRALLHRVADATVRSLLDSIAEVLSAQD